MSDVLEADNLLSRASRKGAPYPVGWQLMSAPTPLGDDKTREWLSSALGLGITKTETVYVAPDRAKDAGKSVQTTSLDTGTGLEKALFDTCASFKVYFAQIAMHLSSKVRAKLFRQLDQLMDVEEWPDGDVTPLLASFRTLTRLLLHLKPERWPGIGSTSNGNLVAMWSAGETNRLSIECLAGDKVIWVASLEVDGELETGAGTTLLTHLRDRLAPYSPLQWFNANSVHPA